MEDLTNGIDMDGLMSALILTAGDWVGRLVLALIILVAGRMLAKGAKRLLMRGMEGARVDVTLRSFGGTLVYWGVMLLVAIAILGTLGIEILSFVAILGAAGLAVGLAFQGTLSNFASGIMLLLFRPLSVGDGVSIAGVTGVVKEIGLFSLIMDTFDGVRVVVPNSQVYGETITNYSTNPTRRMDLTAGVSYDDDLRVAEEVLRTMVGSDDRILQDPAPVVAVTELADSSVNFMVRVWTASSDFWQTQWDLTRRIKDDLEAAGCSIPYPQSDVHLFRQDGDAGDEGGPGEPRGRTAA